MLISKSVIGISFIIFALIAFYLWQTRAYKTPEPAFTSVTKSGSIEVRIYPKIVIAEVVVSGERYAAINAGFRKLADYIFGNNITHTQIAMTAPVIQKGEKIAMTAPVKMQAKNKDNWVVQFVMPSGSSLANLPTPMNKEIKLHEVPDKKYVVIRFSGGNTNENMESHLAELNAYIHENKIEIVGEPIMAFYNPPWILPIFRRNEIMLEMK